MSSHLRLSIQPHKQLANELGYEEEDNSDWEDSDDEGEGGKEKEKEGRKKVKNEEDVQDIEMDEEFELVE